MIGVSGMTISLFAFCWKFVPETKGKHLEDIRPTSRPGSSTATAKRLRRRNWLDPRQSLLDTLR